MVIQNLLPGLTIGDKNCWPESLRVDTSGVWLGGHGRCAVGVVPENKARLPCQALAGLPRSALFLRKLFARFSFTRVTTFCYRTVSSSTSIIVFTFPYISILESCKHLCMSAFIIPCLRCGVRLCLSPVLSLCVCPGTVVGCGAEHDPEFLISTYKYIPLNR